MGFRIDTVVVHHSGGLGRDMYASTKHLTLEHIDRAHQAKWPQFKSELGYWVGYNFLIFPDGKVFQTRKIGEETAHTVGLNTRAIGICFVGNANEFASRPIDEVTQEAINSYRNLIQNIKQKSGIEIKEGTIIDFSINRIYPHRTFSLTDCYGTFLSDSWCRDILRDKPKLSINVIIQVYLLLKRIYGEQKALSEFKKIISAIGSVDGDRECSGNI